jgi:hypothetical protein
MPTVGGQQQANSGEVTTRKEADLLAFFFLQKDFLATSCNGLRRPWQKAEIYAAKKI